MREHGVVALGAHLDRKNAAHRQVVASFPALAREPIALGFALLQHFVNDRHLRLEASGRLLRLGEQRRKVRLIDLGEYQPRALHRRDPRLPGSFYEREPRAIVLQQLFVITERNVVRLIAPHALRIEEPLDVRGHHIVVSALALLGVALRMHGDEDAARLVAEPRERIRTEAGVDRG